MPERTYLPALDVEALHVFIMEKTGDAPSFLKDRSLLESAVMRPQMAAYYAHADLVNQCAVLAVGISQARAFVEGNKRTAFVAADIFLQANGGLFTGDPLEMARQLEMVATRTGNEEEATYLFTHGLRAHVTCQGSVFGDVE